MKLAVATCRPVIPAPPPIAHVRRELRLEHGNRHDNESGREVGLPGNDRSKPAHVIERRELGAVEPLHGGAVECVGVRRFWRFDERGRG